MSRADCLSVDELQEQEDAERSPEAPSPSRAVTLIVRGLERVKRPEQTIRRLAVLLLIVEIIVTLTHDDGPALNGTGHIDPHPVGALKGLSLSIKLIQLIVPVGASNDDAYTDASVESPTVEALEEDDDDEELDASATNDYPEGENDNDESYDDENDDDRQESRITERWIKPAVTHYNSSLFQLTM